MKITNEALRECYAVLWDKYVSCRASGEPREDIMAMSRASLEFWAPILLAEPDGKESADAESHMRTNDTQEISRPITAANVLRCFVLDRRRAALAKLDPAVEGVRAELNRYSGAIGSEDICEKIVAVVDAARGRETRSE